MATHSVSPVSAVQRLTLVVLLSCLLAGPADARQAVPEEDAKAMATLLETGITLLEARDYAGFLKTCARPSEVEELIAEFGSIEAVGEAYGETDRPAGMLAVLKAARGQQPTMSANGARATYAFAETVGGERRLVLVKVDGRWFLYD